MSITSFSILYQIVPKWCHHDVRNHSWLVRCFRPYAFWSKGNDDSFSPVTLEPAAEPHCPDSLVMFWMDWCLAEKSDGSSAQEDVTLQMNIHTMFITKSFLVLKPFLFCKYWSFLSQIGGYLELVETSRNPAWWIFGINGQVLDALYNTKVQLSQL